jgi:hypothetical protein
MTSAEFRTSHQPDVRIGSAGLADDQLGGEHDRGVDLLAREQAQQLPGDGLPDPLDRLPDP